MEGGREESEERKDGRKEGMRSRSESKTGRRRETERMRKWEEKLALRGGSKEEVEEGRERRRRGG